MKLAFSRLRAVDSFGAEENWVDAIFLRMRPCFLVVHGMIEHHSAANELAPKCGLSAAQRRQIVVVGRLDDFGAPFGAVRIGCLLRNIHGRGGSISSLATGTSGGLHRHLLRCRTGCRCDCPRFAATVLVV